MAYQNLLIEQKDRIQYIIINRESKLNALNKDTVTELHTACTAAFTDASVGGIIVTGQGQKAFVAGADIAEFAALDSETGVQLARRGHGLCDLIENGPKPVIAAINGFALGGGLELAMACHIRIAADNAKVGLPEASLGLIPGYGGTQRLTRLAGKGKALEMIMTADMVTAAEAYRCGLVNYVVSQDELLPKAEEVMGKILSRAPQAITAAIASVNAACSNVADGFAIEIAAFGQCCGTEDFKEGVSAFLGKRKPQFTGR